MLFVMVQFSGVCTVVGVKWIGPFGTPLFDPKIHLKKFMWVHFLRPFPGNEAHKLFCGGPNLGVLGGGQKFMLKEFMCFFGPLVLETLGFSNSLRHPHSVSRVLLASTSPLMEHPSVMIVTRVGLILWSAPVLA